MRRFIVIATLAALICSGADAKKKKQQVETVTDVIRTEIAATPEKAGGVYYAYPFTTDSMAPAPAGYEPFYISHYGRHGSRWVISESTHTGALKVLTTENEKGNLTELGQQILEKVEFLKKHTDGHHGELSALGERQHKGIASRMITRFPELFKGDSRIIARSSTSPRCILSMAAFSEELKKHNPDLNIERHATPSDMKFIMNHTEANKQLEDKNASWRKKFANAKDSLFKSEKTAVKIFKDPSKVKDLPRQMQYLFDVAVDVQDVDGTQDYGYLDIFEPEDRYNMWKGLNYQLYVRQGNSPDATGAGPRSATNLLNEIVDSADKAIAGERPTAVDLRFGHDTALLRLFALMGLEGCDASVPGFENAAKEWQTYKITPMAANFQLVLFKNANGDVIAAPRHNERPVKVNGVKEMDGAPGYYKWSDLRDAWKSACSRMADIAEG